LTHYLSTSLPGNRD
jgi:S-(hydroxymethyl)glutathione dehydrogenase/alcohol dehydrogenase